MIKDFKGVVTSTFEELKEVGANSCRLKTQLEEQDKKREKLTERILRLQVQ